LRAACGDSLPWSANGQRVMMGTSSSHRSPSTTEWERVKRLYRGPMPDPGQLAGAIVSALDTATRHEMSGPGVGCCLSLLLRASDTAAAGGLDLLLASTPATPPLLSLSQMLRDQAEREIAARGYASRFADIALNALGTATFEAAASGAASVFDITGQEAAASLAAFSHDRRLHALSLCFLAHDFDHVFRYFVTRDTTDCLGGADMPSIAHASQLRDAVAAYCRGAVARVEAAVYEQSLAAALREDTEPCGEGIQTILSELTKLSLERISSGG
jgi:hypothetical protein